MHGFSRTFYGVVLCLTACLAISVLGCSETQRVTLDECGNHIVEPGEDCDGAEGCSNACRLTCKSDQNCPSGWGCARSAGICRTADRDFDAHTLSTEGDGWLTIADFDGDLRDDLLSVSRFETGLSSVVYFDAAGAIERTVTLPVAGWGAAGDVTGDGFPDALLGGSTAAAFRSTKARTFSPLAGALRQVTPQARLFAADIDCDGLRDFLLLGGDASKPDDTLFNIAPNGDLKELGRLRISSAQLHALENPFATAEDPAALSRAELVATGSLPDPRHEFENFAGYSCQTLALPASGANAVDVYTFLDSPAAALAKPVRVTYGVADEAAPSRFFFADIDGDYNDDLVICGPSEQWVSYGVGDGTFHSDVTTLPVPFTTGGDGGAETLFIDDEVLAAGELDGIYGTDFFTADFSDDLGLRYQSARALDLTGDGLPDVAAVGRSRRIDVFRGHPNGLVSRLSMRLAGFPRIEDVGDFDGDGIVDLLFSEANAEDEHPRLASVLFAPVKSDTATPTELVGFDRIEQLAAAYLPGSDGPPDANMDIGALFGAGQALQLGFMAGGADRLLRSELPTLRSAGEGYEDSIPVVGHFHSAQDPELLVIKDSFSFDERIRIERLATDAGGIAVVNSTPLPAVLAFDTVPAVLDLDGDGFDELYLALQTGLLVVTATSEGFASNQLFETEPILWLSVQDANRDGFRDLTALGEDGLLLILGGSPSTSRVAHRFPYAQLDCSERVDYAFIQADSDAEPELVVNCAPEASFIVTYDEPQGTDKRYPAFAAPSLRLYDVDLTHDRLTLGRELPALEQGHLATGDFNGDGLDDIVGGSTKLTILLGKPKE